LAAESHFYAKILSPKSDKIPYIMVGFFIKIPAPAAKIPGKIQSSAARNPLDFSRVARGRNGKKENMNKL